jgi:protein-arginine kinase
MSSIASRERNIKNRNFAILLAAIVITPNANSAAMIVKADKTVTVITNILNHLVLNCLQSEAPQ